MWASLPPTSSSTSDCREHSASIYAWHCLCCQMLLLLTLHAASLRHRKTRSAFLQSLVAHRALCRLVCWLLTKCRLLCVCVQTKPFLWLGLNPIAIFCLMVRASLRLLGLHAAVCVWRVDALCASWASLCRSCWRFCCWICSQKCPTPLTESPSQEQVRFDHLLLCLCRSCACLCARSLRALRCVRSCVAAWNALYEVVFASWITNRKAASLVVALVHIFIWLLCGWWMHAHKIFLKV